MLPLNGAAMPGAATNGSVLECAAGLRPQPPPRGWQPLNSSGADLRRLQSVLSVLPQPECGYVLTP